VMSYWSANDMLWMDGVGSDGAGPCPKDDAAACAESVHFSNFSISSIFDEDGSVATTEPGEKASEGAQSLACAGENEDCRSMPCCSTPAMKCHRDGQWWSSCQPLETLHEALIGLQEQVITDCPGGKKGNCSRPSNSAGDRDNRVQVLVSIKASDLPSSWGQGKEIVIRAEHHQLRGEVVRMAGIPDSTSAHDALESAAAAAAAEDTRVMPFVTTRAAMIALVVLAITATVFRKVCTAGVPMSSWWQRGVHAFASAKSHLQMNKAAGSNSGPSLSLHLGESPVRRRKGDGGVGQAPQEAGAHPRWPSDAQVTPQVSTPGRWPLMSRA